MKIIDFATSAKIIAKVKKLAQREKQRRNQASPPTFPHQQWSIQ
ncbi:MULTISPECIES: hypothetical protein [Helicobacter]|nr:hypothetical protein [Helicobacter sp. MIT 03-1616]